MPFTLKRTVSHTAIYSIGVVVQNITSIVMIPIYTRFLSPADYGVIELLAMVLDVTAILFGMRVDQGLFRYYHAAKSDGDRNAVVSTTFFLTLGLNAIGMLAILIFSKPLSAGLLGDASLSTSLMIYSLCMLAPSLVGMPYNLARLQNRPGLFLVLSLTKLAVQVSLNILFVVVLEMKALGVILGSVTTQVLLGVAYSIWMLRSTGLVFRGDLSKRLFSFSLPLVLASIASFYLVFGDRYFLREAWGLAAVGIYGLAYRCGFGFISLTYDPFCKAWSSHKYDLLKSPDPVSTYQLIFGLGSKALLVAALAASVFIRDLLQYFVGAEFRSAGEVVPLLLAAFVIRALGDYSNFGLLLNEKTRHLAHASWIAAGVMTIGYLVLIPEYGIYGAAITTFVGFATEAWWIHRTASAQYNMHLEWRRVALSGTIALLTFLVCEYLRVTGDFGSLVARSFIVASACVAIYFLPSTAPRERAALRSMLSMAASRTKRILGREK